MEEEIMTKISHITGVILAGGKSARFGQNKAFALFEGTPFIERVLKVMRLTFSKVMIVTNSPADFAHLKVLVLADSIPCKGPLGGIMTALQQTTDDGIFAVGCDMPCLSPFVIRRVLEKVKNHLAAVPEHDGIKEYLMAYYAKKLASTILSFLRQERLSLAALCEFLTNIVWVPVEGKSWINVNTRKDLELLPRRMSC